MRNNRNNLIKHAKKSFFIIEKIQNTSSAPSSALDGIFSGPILSTTWPVWTCIEVFLSTWDMAGCKDGPRFNSFGWKLTRVGHFRYFSIFSIILNIYMAGCKDGPRFNSFGWKCRSWALSVFFNFFNNKKFFFAFFMKLLTYFCTSPI